MLAVIQLHEASLPTTFKNCTFDHAAPRKFCPQNVGKSSCEIAVNSPVSMGINKAVKSLCFSSRYVGEMSRDVADSILNYLPAGSFMIRQSVSANRVDKFALSLKLVTSLIFSPFH